MNRITESVRVIIRQYVAVTSHLESYESIEAKTWDYCRKSSISSKNNTLDAILESLTGFESRTSVVAILSQNNGSIALKRSPVLPNATLSVRGSFKEVTRKLTIQATRFCKSGGTKPSEDARRDSLFENSCGERTLQPNSNQSTTSMEPKSSVAQFNLRKRTTASVGSSTEFERPTRQAKLLLPS